MSVFGNPLDARTNYETKWEIRASIKIYLSRVRHHRSRHAARAWPVSLISNVNPECCLNMVQSRPATPSAIVVVAREHLHDCRMGTWFLWWTHIQTFTRVHIHTRTRVRMRMKMKIDSLFEDFLDCDSNDCHLFVSLVYPIYSSAGCHKLAFYDAAKRTMGFALNSVEEE